ncbi:MAG TPA: restriction endonuclease subunit S [Sedimentisphaerales bacterium]|nr:restriction endonuclease subunit S [Sedimentisphaerales bacterium]
MNTDNFTHDLPEGWAEANLQDLIGLDGVLTDGDWIETKDQDPQGNVRLIQLADIGDGFYRNRSQRFLTSEKAQRLNCTFLKHGDVLVARMPEPLGRACIFPGDEKPAVTAVDVCVVRTGSPGVDHSWLVGVVNSPKMREEIERLQKGTTRKRISKKNLISVKFPVPPYPEQRRIGAKIEELLDIVQKATNHLERVPAIIENFRKAVLDAACSGRLTEDWREKHPDSETAKQLLKQVKGQWGVEGEKGDYIDLDLELPPSWILAKISEFTSKVGSGATPRGGKSSYKAEGVPLIRSQNVHFDGFRDEGIAYLDEKQAASLDAATVKNRDVLLNITGASIGRVTQAPPRMHGARVNQHVCIIRPCRVVDPVWLSCFLASPFMQDHIMKIQYGVTRQALTKGQILNLVVPIPPTEEQREIVRRVQNLFSLSVKALKRLQCATQKIEKLTQAILAKAFSGELVPTEAELARRQGRTYETAVQLLKRIKLEREKKRTIELKVEKIKVRSKVMGVLRGLKKRPILEVLSEAQGKLKPEELFRKANFTEEFVDDFYEELRAAVQAGQIKESRPKKTEIYLEAVKT